MSFSFGQKVMFCAEFKPFVYRPADIDTFVRRETAAGNLPGDYRLREGDVEPTTLRAISDEEQPRDSYFFPYMKIATRLSFENKLGVIIGKTTIEEVALREANGLEEKNIQSFYAIRETLLGRVYKVIPEDMAALIVNH